jgi:hypothetical protein
VGSFLLAGDHPESGLCKTGAGVVVRMPGWCHAGWMTEVLLDGINGRRLTVSSASTADADDIWSYHAALILPEGGMEAMVWDLGDGLARFLRELADSWGGFEGVKEFQPRGSILTLLPSRRPRDGRMRCDSPTIHASNVGSQGRP